ncbi:hypothetical protein, partial [Legionella cherrii]|uniref:hypothetical protein n=1 Tax=Legionella cherrii TaxID=28084 RepID=UPI001ED9B298
LRLFKTAFVAWVEASSHCTSSKSSLLPVGRRCLLGWMRVLIVADDALTPSPLPYMEEGIFLNLIAVEHNHNPRMILDITLMYITAIQYLPFKNDFA